MRTETENNCFVEKGTPRFSLENQGIVWLRQNSKYTIAGISI